MEDVTEGDLRVFLARPPFGMHDVPEDDLSVFMEAVTTSSFSNEQKQAGHPCRDYQRLEYLGDAVIEFTVCEDLYLNTTYSPSAFSEAKEDHVKNRGLYEHIASQLDLWKVIRMSQKNYDNLNEAGREGCYADVCEALVGAMYICRGLDSARDLVMRTVMRDFEPEVASDERVISDDARRARVRAFIEDMDPLCEDRHLGEDQLDIFCEALTYSSYSNEIRDAKNNQNLSLLGSALLQMLVSDHDYRSLPDMPEGELTQHKQKAISKAQIAKYLMNSGISVSEGIVSSSAGPFEPGVRADTSDSMDVKTFKAIIAAYYLTFGMDDARELVQRVIIDHMPSVELSLF